MHTYIRLQLIYTLISKVIFVGLVFTHWLESVRCVRLCRERIRSRAHTCVGGGTLIGGRYAYKFTYIDLLGMFLSFFFLRLRRRLPPPSSSSEGGLYPAISFWYRSRSSSACFWYGTLSSSPISFHRSAHSLEKTVKFTCFPFSWYSSRRPFTKKAYALVRPFGLFGSLFLGGIAQRR